jgi:hypothetical protein
MTKDEALRLALEALTVLLDEWTPARQAQLKGMDAITAIKQALAKQEQGEPVAYVKTIIEALYENSDPVSVEAAELLERITTPPQRTWVGLTDAEINKIRFEWLHYDERARAIEAKLKEKNT